MAFSLRKLELKMFEKAEGRDLRIKVFVHKLDNFKLSRLLCINLAISSCPDS